MEVSVSAAFDAPAIVDPVPALALLRAMADEVHRVVQATESECRRLGLIK